MDVVCDIYIVYATLAEREGQDNLLYRILFFGDQLTAERARKCQEYKVSDCSSEEALLGLVPAVSDWHAEANFLQVYTMCGGVNVMPLHSLVYKYTCT